MRRKSALEGPVLVLWSAVVAVVISLVIVIDAGPIDAGLRSAIRATARQSLVLFGLTFVASSVNALWRGPTGKWLLRNRKFLGNGMAASHAVHGVLIVWLAALDPARLLATTSASGFYGGLAGYGLLLAMVVTSFPGPTRRLGRRRWVLLHTFGMYALFVIFVVSYLGRALGGSTLASLALGALALAQGLRIAARLRRRRPA